MAADSTPPRATHGALANGGVVDGGLPPAAAAVVASGALLVPAVSGMVFGLGRPQSLAWYRALRKPPWKPPDAAVPLVWTLIDASLAWAAYRLLRRRDEPPRRKALGLLALNVGLTGGWSALFFGRRHLPASAAVAAVMVGTGAATVAQARRVDPVAARASLPFVVWVAFATALTVAIWRRNRGR